MLGLHNVPYHISLHAHIKGKKQLGVHQRDVIPDGGLTFQHRSSSFFLFLEDRQTRTEAILRLTAKKEKEVTA